MNDPGLHEPIKENVNQVRHDLQGQIDANSSRGHHHEPRTAKEAWLQEIQDDDDEEEVGFYRPNRWWFTSTAFPLIAGTFGPIGNLFSICALVQTWRVKIPDGGTEAQGERVKDPSWLIAVNSVSLAFSLLGNLFILFNFAHRVKYAIAQPLTISLWYGAAILLLVPVCLTKELVIQPTYAYAFSQSYYYGIICVVIYLIISSLLIINCIGAYVFKAYPPSFNSLTIPQRTLMLQTIAYVLYLALGGGVFSAIEGWAFVDGLYWTDYTLLTIGLGSDFQLRTNLGKGLLIPYAVIGIMMVGLIVGSIRGLVLDRGKLKVKRRQLGKERERWERKLDHHGKDQEKSKWNREEFEAMRRIEERAEKIRKYTSLNVSLFAFLVVWFMGALVFWFSERPQNWTYFQSLYFAYTSLLTIGYGDYYPQSNAGKPFFVIWSLIAVPTVTILISNLGDTIVGWLRDGTLWIGQRTILPEGATVKMKSLQGFKEALGREQKHEEEDAGDGESQEHLREDVEKLGGAVEKAETGSGRPRGLGARIAREIKVLANDIGMKPPRKYGWEEWVRWLELLGNQSVAKDGIWLGDDGPLFSGQSETEWILGKLCERLEQVLEEEMGGNQKKTTDTA